MQAFSSCGAPASPCGGFSCRAQALGMGFSNCDTGLTSGKSRTLEHAGFSRCGLNSCGLGAQTVIVADGLSCSMARGIFLDQGSNPCPPALAAEFLPLGHQGSPDSLNFSFTFEEF